METDRNPDIFIKKAVLSYPGPIELCIKRDSQRIEEYSRKVELLLEWLAGDSVSYTVAAVDSRDPDFFYST